jgi:formate C-acetyltransferase
MTRRVLDDFVELAGAVPERNGVLRPPGVSTFEFVLGWREKRRGVASGLRMEDTPAFNFSPTPGSDRRGPTAVLKSYGAMGLQRLGNGTALDVTIHPVSVRNEVGLKAMVALFRSFVRLNGLYLFFNVLDHKTLRDAQVHPERHRNLSVRISGWCARFVTLNKDFQELVIRRTEHEF